MGAIWTNVPNAEDGIDPDFDDDLWVSQGYIGKWKAGKHHDGPFATEDNYSEESFA